MLYIITYYYSSEFEIESLNRIVFSSHTTPGYMTGMADSISDGPCVGVHGCVKLVIINLGTASGMSW